jgi:thioredoxin 1
MSDVIKSISDDSFEKLVIAAELPVLLDFWAPWCGPCNAITPVLEEIAKLYASKLIVAKINIDENSVTPQKFGVRGIPTLILFKNGEVESMKVGPVSKSQLSAFLDSHL